MLAHFAHNSLWGGLFLRLAKAPVGYSRQSWCQCQNSFLRELGSPRRYSTTSPSCGSGANH